MKAREKDMKKTIDQYLRKNPDLAKTINLFNISHEQYVKAVSAKTSVGIKTSNRTELTNDHVG